MNIYIPYTYYLFHKPTGLKYYGCAYVNSFGNGVANPSQLWNTYFSSSKKVKLLIDEYGIRFFRISNKKDFLDWQTSIGVGS